MCRIDYIARIVQTSAIVVWGRYKVIHTLSRSNSMENKIKKIPIIS